MIQRSFFWASAFMAFAGLAFATPSHAASVTVTTDITFSVSNGGTASDVEVDYAPTVDPISGLTLTMTGGLTGTSLTETPGSPSVIELTFTPAGASTGTIEWTFQTASPPAMYNASGSGVPDNDTITISANVHPLGSTPEPSSVALLGIGVAGFLACRRFFRRPACGRAS